MTAGHPSQALLDRYATEVDLPPDALWAVEVHLDGCAACRARLADAAVDHAPSVGELVDQVWAEVAPVVRAEPPVRRRRWPVLSRWAAPASLPWLLTSVLVPFVAMAMDLIAATLPVDPGRPSVLLLVAPVVPVLGVATSWSRRLDPAHELVGSAPRAGLGMVLRRTLVVLLVVLPPLAVAGVVVGTAPALWLLPSLVVVTGTLTLGAYVGVGPAAVLATVGWVAAVVAPSLVWDGFPAVLGPDTTPVWAVCAVLATIAFVLSRHAFRHPVSYR
ncbi:hypothetical protein ABT336_01160 [Micromonospora sp. NPDC000207]|uniref:hypothetical protein n=1 Tax=Micromonospora sp. NPDC000207 TaxID=3154246 RepID=UPI00333204F7